MLLVHHWATIVKVIELMQDFPRLLSFQNPIVVPSIGGRWKLIGWLVAAGITSALLHTSQATPEHVYIPGRCFEWRSDTAPGSRFVRYCGCTPRITQDNTQGSCPLPRTAWTPKDTENSSECRSETRRTWEKQCCYSKCLTFTLFIHSLIHRSIHRQWCEPCKGTAAHQEQRG